ncbi:MAG: CarD family transcriptional regulator [Xanthomonadales bacterium]|nr:CarD family transcriptional regulator [Xanthomonadales bacterium]
MIFHPQHGVGQIQPIDRETIMGQASKSFVKVFFKRDKLTMIMRSDDLNEQARKIISKAESKRVLNHLKSGDATMSTRWQSRIKANESAIESGDPFQLATVYKGLTQLEESGETLRAADRKHLKTSLEGLIEELAAALGQRRKKIEALITA